MALLGGVLLSTKVIAADVPRTGPNSSSAVFAKVGDTIVLQQDYENALAGAMHRKYFHGKIPDDRVAALQHEVADKLVADTLLLQEARRRGLKPDEAAIRQTMQQYEQRYRGNIQWQQVRTQILPSLNKKLQEESLLHILEKQVRDVSPPQQKQIDDYYAAHPDKFTEPEQMRLAVILLRVDPSSPTGIWEKSHQEGQNLVNRIRDGADFAALAKTSSDDSSAASGGDMGYLHRGMLPQLAQDTVDKLKPGEVSEPIKLLEGIAILRLIDRRSPRLNKLDTVRDRVRDLWQREQGEQAWTTLVANLKQKTPVHLDESLYLAISTASKEHVIDK